jgi:hypothetical protein
VPVPDPVAPVGALDLFCRAPEQPARHGLGQTALAPDRTDPGDPKLRCPVLHHVEYIGTSDPRPQFSG